MNMRICNVVACAALALLAACAIQQAQAADVLVAPGAVCSPLRVTVRAFTANTSEIVDAAAAKDAITVSLLTDSAGTSLDKMPVLLKGVQGSVRVTNGGKDAADLGAAPLLLMVVDVYSKGPTRMNVTTVCPGAAKQSLAPGASVDCTFSATPNLRVGRDLKTTSGTMAPASNVLDPEGSAASASGCRYPAAVTKCIRSVAECPPKSCGEVADGCGGYVKCPGCASDNGKAMVCATDNTCVAVPVSPSPPNAAGTTLFLNSWVALAAMWVLAMATGFVA